VKPTASSAIKTFRWVRWLTCPGRKRCKGRNQWTCAPRRSKRSRVHIISTKPDSKCSRHLYGNGNQSCQRMYIYRYCHSYSEYNGTWCKWNWW
jgi:hypothetical protein